MTETAALPAFLPTSRVPDPATAPALRWGILAPGGIAEKFTETVLANTSQQIVAVGSRSLERAESFATRHGIEAAYGSYEQLLADPDVQAIYVASPHSEHCDHALAAIAAGKHTLVEKAFTRNAAEARKVFSAAEAAGVMAMEAMWTRFLPHIDVIRQLLADGALGEVTTILADHGQSFGHLPHTHRLYNPELAGGALLDLGVYPVSFAAFAMGEPRQISAVGTRTAEGVDAQIAIALAGGPDGPDGAPSIQAALHTTLTARTPTRAAICGTVARVEIDGPFYTPQRITMTANRSGEVLTREVDGIAGHYGLCYQAAEFARRVTAGETESPLLPSAETVSIMATMDEIRRQVGVVYPGE